MRLFAILIYGVTSSSFQVGNWGFIPQDRPQTYSWDAAARQCKINFGPEFGLATFDNEAEVNSVVACMNNNGINTHAYWVGYTDLNVAGLGQLNQAFDGDFPWMENEPSESGDEQPCVRFNNGEFNDVACDMLHSGAAKNLIGMGVICKRWGVDYVNTAKKNKMFYCDLEQIGLVELVNGKLKEGKYSLKNCKKKRAAAPKGMLKMSGGRLELDCTDCKKDTVVWSKVECQVSCKADKTGNKLSAGFGCEPVFDENNAVIGSRYIFSDGFRRFQEICGGGCAEHELHQYLGPGLTSVEAKKCSVRDIHHPGSFTSKQYCQFSCPSHHDKNSELTTTNSLYCKCETMDVSTDGVSKRECNWRIKKGGYPALDAKKKGEYIEPLLFGVDGVDQCKDAFYLTTTSTTTTTTTTTTPTSNSLAAMLFINTKHSSHTPHLIDATGELSTSFDTNGQDVFQSCGVTFQNKQLIFGGNTHRRQILQVDSCSLTSVGSIPFDHYRAACGSTAGVIVLCFNYDEFATVPDGLRRRRDGSDANDAKRCRQATSPSGPWTEMALSTYEHQYTSIAASPDEFLAVGSFDPDSKKAELYSFGTGKWKTVGDYPISGTRMTNFEILYIPETSSYLVIGGYWNNFSQRKISQFKNGVWSHAGRLNSPRHGSRAKLIGNALIVAGGNKVQSSEVCTIDPATGEFVCHDILPKMEQTPNGVTFAVPSNFCP